MAKVLKSLSLKFAAGTKTTDGPTVTTDPGIFEAAKVGDSTKVLEYLQAGVDVDAREPKLHRTALHYAAARGKVDVIQLLVYHDCDLEATDDQGWTAVLYAAATGKEGSLRELLRHGASIDARGSLDGASALHAAAQNGDLAIVQALLENKADPNVVDNAGRTPLHYAAAHSSFGALSELLVGGDPKALENFDLGANDNAAGTDDDDDDDFGGAGEPSSSSNGGAASAGLSDPRFVKMNTLLRMATRAARHDEAVIGSLMAKGANINARDKQGCTPLFQAVLVGSDDAAMVMVAKGADATITDTALGRNPLHYAAEKGHLLLLRRLIKAGADVNGVDVTGYTPLMLAVRKGDGKAITALLEAGASPDPANHTDGRSALHMAVSGGDSAAVAILLGAGATIDPKDVNGTTPLLLAAELKAAECVKTLCAKGADPNATGANGELPLVVAAVNGDLATVQALIAGGANVNATGINSSSVLHAMAEEPPMFDPDILAAVIKAGGDLALPRSDDGLSPLHLAAGSGNAAFLSYVLEGEGVVPVATGKKLASVSLTDAKITPLHLAAFAGQEAAAEVLVRAGVALGARDADGLTPAERAEQEGEDAVASLLRS